jgi:hypothetical protein
MEGCGHCCACKTEEPPPAPSDFSANTAAQSKSLVPEITWVLAGLESFVRNLRALASPKACLLQSLCVSPAHAVERRILHCTFQT